VPTRLAHDTDAAASERAIWAVRPAVDGSPSTGWRAGRPSTDWISVQRQAGAQPTVFYFYVSEKKMQSQVTD
jgi:hypothetical protein